ncbi:MAG: AzlC family ABC transporter permease [Planctomycetes bacterium]|nr:AzlC family ABC transporter permease [Planctomycetota bacterium]
MTQPSARHSASRPRHIIAASFASAFAASIPVLAGYLFLGAGYGILMSNIGYGPGWTALTSILVFGGTIQYVATSLLAAGFAPLYALVISLVVNARHLFYGISMLDRYAGAGWKKFFLIFWLTDETFSLVCNDDEHPGTDKNWRRFFISGLNYCYWIAGGLIGNTAGHLLDFNFQGIEFVMTALFTVIVVNQWRSAKNHLPALIGGGASLVCLLAFGPDLFIIPAMIAIAGLLMLFRSRIEPDQPAPGGCE